MTTTPNAVSVDYSASDFIPIARSEILAVHQLPADIFLKISDTKVILIGRQGAKSIDDLHVLDDENISSFYVRKHDYKNCVGQNLLIAGIIVEKSDISALKKVEFLSKTAVSVFKEIEAVGFNHESLEHSKSVSKSIQTLVSAKSDFVGVLDIMSDISNDLLRHSMAVSAVSVMIARAMGWNLQSTLEKLALAALLHDIGMKELPKELLEKPRHEMTQADRQLYETHVFRGAEILSTMPSATEELVAIAREHHENAVGLGYPRRIREIKINPLARVVGLADCFCELTLKNIDHPNPKSAAEAIAHIETTLGQPFSKSAFVGLKLALHRPQAGGKIQRAA